MFAETFMNFARDGSIVMTRNDEDTDLCFGIRPKRRRLGNTSCSKKDSEGDTDRDDTDEVDDEQDGSNSGCIFMSFLHVENEC